MESHARYQFRCHMVTFNRESPINLKKRLSLSRQVYPTYLLNLTIITKYLCVCLLLEMTSVAIVFKFRPRLQRADIVTCKDLVYDEGVDMMDRAGYRLVFTLLMSVRSCKCTVSYPLLRRFYVHGYVHLTSNASNHRQRLIDHVLKTVR